MTPQTSLSLYLFIQLVPDQQRLQLREVLVVLQGEDALTAGERLRPFEGSVIFHFFLKHLYLQKEISETVWWNEWSHSTLTRNGDILYIQNVYKSRILNLTEESEYVPQVWARRVGS